MTDIPSALADEQDEDLNQSEPEEANEETQTEPEQVDEEQPHETAESEEDLYAKAWDNIDTSKAPEELFGETAAKDEPEEVAEEQDDDTGANPEQVPEANGLLIPNPVLKRKGKEIRIDSPEEMIALAEKGFDYSFKMGKIKPYMGMVKIIEKAGLSIEDIRALADLKSGKKEAIGYLKKSAGIKEESSDDFSHVFGADSDSNESHEYTPEVPESDPVKDWFHDFSEQDPVQAAKVAKVYESIDDSFKAEVYTPQLFPLFAGSVASGEFDRIYPEAMKLKAINPALSWMQAYTMAGQKLQAGQKVEKQAKRVPPKETRIPKNTEAKRKRGSSDDYERAWEMDIKELESKLFGN